MIDKVGGGADIQKLIALVKQLLEQLQSNKGKAGGAEGGGGSESMSPEQLAKLFKQAIEEAQSGNKQATA